MKIAGGMLVAALVLGLTTADASAQRRPLAPPPAELSVLPDGHAHRFIVSVEAREAIELAADRRFLRVEIRDARGRRVTCAPATRPRPETRTRALAIGERWSEWFDIRELCWGRSLAALAGAREVTFHFDAGRARGAWVARTATTRVRSLAPVASAWRPPAAPAVVPGAMVISLSPADALRGGRPTFRVRVAGGDSRMVRAYVRPESVSFRVTTPSGGSVDCRLPPFAGRPLPDFFARFSARSARLFALDAVAYCGRFEEPGLYEVTPILRLDETGAEWDLRGVTGSFEGAPVPLRIRRTTYVEQPVEVRR